MNNHFNGKYEQLIEPLYGKKRDLTTDADLLKDNILPHSFNINERVDMTMYHTYRR